MPGVGLLEPPHVSPGCPWLPAGTALEALPRVVAAALEVPAFRAELTGPYRFGADQRGRVVVYARLRDDGPVRELARLGADLRETQLSTRASR